MTGRFTRALDDILDVVVGNVSKPPELSWEQRTRAEATKRTRGTRTRSTRATRTRSTRATRGTRGGR